MLFPLKLPPGQYGNGTAYQAKGRWWKSLLARFIDGTVRPQGGWVTFSLSTLSGKARAIITWIDNIGAPWIAVGTHTKLYAVSGSGTVTDISPVALSAGYPDASSAGGYGTFTYGYDTYGTARPDDGSLTPATVWTLDTFGQKLIACNGADGRIYEWDVDTSVVATVIAGSPAGVRGIIVTGEGFLMALGTDANPRLISWADQASLTDWTPGEPSQAGFYALQTTGKLMAGVRLAGVTGIFTDTDFHIATYLGPPYLFGFERRGTGCGLIGQRAFVAATDNLVFWMGDAGFHYYNGQADTLDCTVRDAVFSDFNTTQRSKVTAYYEPAYDEVTWFYPSASSDENDTYVRYNHRENHWTIGDSQSALARLAGTARGGGFSTPFATDDSGNVLQLETGFAYGGFTPYVETGPIELGGGERSVNVMQIIPDEGTLGDIRRTLYGAFHPTDTETTYGPYTSAQPIDTRLQARQFRQKIEFISGDDARYGDDRLDISQAGGRR